MLAGARHPGAPPRRSRCPTPLARVRRPPPRLPRAGRHGHREPQPARVQRLQGLLGRRRADHPAGRRARSPRRSPPSSRRLPTDADLAAASPTSAPPVGDDSLEAAYLDDVIGPARPAARARAAGIVYTPLHGVGAALLRRALFERAGFAAARRGGRRSPSPIPSSPRSRSRTPRRRARWTGRSRWPARAAADLVLANDPDADRLAVAVPRARRPVAACSPATRSARCSADYLLATTAGADADRRIVATRSSRRSCSA